MPDPAVAAIRSEALRFENVSRGLRPLLDAIGDARLVLIGEASHGTHEFYQIRAELTQVLIRERGFTLVAAEADWPDAYRANRWVRGASSEAGPEAALGDFTRFPRWMWRNSEVVNFLRWLRAHNASLAEQRRAGFYGLDLYSLHRSIEAVLEYLDKVDPAAATRARERYACFEMFGEDPQAYGYSTRLGMSRSCEDDVTAQLVDLRREALEYAARNGRVAPDEYFFAEQNARLIANAETYYRAMFAGDADSWNVRDTHMMETLQHLLGYAGSGSRAVIWAHNSHLGDARATQMSARGELNLGQLVRQRFGRDAWLVGFTTHTGSVTAARNWGDPAEKRRVRPSLSGSYERLFHEVGLGRFLLLLREGRMREALRSERLERAIGVIYRPETERPSHYFGARLAQQFDAVIHIDETRALQPLEAWARDEVDLPETYPSGI
ncbi:MAG TPA: erythromycin esterase family protein [Burkholderiales bacterium]|nr:erythromycin esterase family protein [Burkholderiales bacterium]